MIQHIFRRFAGLPFKLERVDEAASGRVAGADLRAALPGMLRRGELSAVKKAWGEKLFYIPADHLPKLWAHLPSFPPKPHTAGSIQLDKEAGPGLGMNLFRALTWIARNGLPTTSKGTIHQKSVSKLARYLYLQEEDVAGLDLRYPHQDVYPPQLAIVLDLLLALGLLQKERTLWGLDSGELTAWLELGPQMQEAILFRELLQRYLPDHVGIQHAAYRLARNDLQEGTWYSLKELYDSLQRLEMLPERLPEEVTVWVGSWLSALSGFGWLDLSKNGGGEDLIRWKSRPRLELLQGLEGAADPVNSDGINPADNRGAAALSGVFYVQPDYEILVPPDVSYRVRWELEACCDNQTMDTMSVYRISRASVARASELGRSPGAVLDFLESSSAGVPENVKLALEQWAGEMGRTSLEEKLLLRCGDEKAADTVASLPALAGMVERIGPRDFIVDAGQSAKVRKALEGVSLAPSKQRNTGSAELEYPKLGEPGSPVELAILSGGRAEERVWIYKGSQLHFYDRSDDAPEPEDLFPGWNEIPNMWLNEMRDYHGSTARKIMSQAIVWKAKVLLRMEGGSIAEFMPVSLTEEERWRVKGRLFLNENGLDGEDEKETILTLGEWEAMRLIQPEFS
ncbi:XPB/Ssl2-like helicase family protein [Fontibacillus phaseoli]|uniref:XPB/Ssl2-like helicase family protein n=1 Tax=Fontibacillus phaseoli TaxID=1416533 RepID=A0A369BQV9_9BACL|nr:helicase-associated domain-containing protein [Fontibacillus phaseoli]RCX23048.1 XPB/Ssl2-like helicase family protein [Fontibacillus phaseoli]